MKRNFIKWIESSYFVFKRVVGTKTVASIGVNASGEVKGRLNGVIVDLKGIDEAIDFFKAHKAITDKENADRLSELKKKAINRIWGGIANGYEARQN